MEKLEGYEEAQALTGEYEVLEAGGYICKIRRANVEKSSTGKRMLVIAFDIAEGEHEGYYQRRYDDLSKTNPNVKWGGIYRQMLEGEKATGYFKGMMTSIEKSNPNFKWDWNEEKLEGLKFGGIFGREEYENQVTGERKMTTKIRFIRTVETIKTGKFEIPTDKMLPERGEAFDSIGTTSDDILDTLPF